MPEAERFRGPRIVVGRYDGPPSGPRWMMQVWVDDKMVDYTFASTRGSAWRMAILSARHHGRLSKRDARH